MLQRYSFRYCKIHRIQQATNEKKEEPGFPHEDNEFYVNRTSYRYRNYCNFSINAIADVERGKEQSENHRCANNLKQLGNCFAQYSVDFNDYVCPASCGVVNLTTGGMCCYFDQPSYFVDTYIYKGAATAGDRYRSAKTILVCPEAAYLHNTVPVNPTGIALNGGTLQKHKSYNVPYAIGVIGTAYDDTYPPFKVSRLRYPTRFPNLYDGTGKNVMMNEADQWLDPGHYNCRVHYRHAAKTNVLYVAGNVSTTRRCQRIINGREGNWTSAYEMKVSAK